MNSDAMEREAVVLAIAKRMVMPFIFSNKRQRAAQKSRGSRGAGEQGGKRFLDLSSYF